ncbi:phosphoribosylanthranilate isomerase [Magnetospira sp. QH-2]|uniref:phosphoribosylanthranilate isomerase n=1 Tax=Magnetospira sp. (strain QH-2) TaxID=1288970 RepID=UPI0003E81B1E|nr:phosphoribosylanthranilate isomerase [Magnetospira sp. QH-2]CCQ72597.1 N-(5'-phosphoribosyl)anthranilate isomerase (PRAI) [Magnetospira sp. QH-2]
MPVDVKICGLTTPETVTCAVEGGAALCGFVFFPPSPRNLEPVAAKPLVNLVPDGITRVGLLVDADDAFIDTLLSHVRLDVLQLHGKETAYRVKEIRERFRLPVMKAVPVSRIEDLAIGRMYEGFVDHLLFDARPPRGATRPGGNALAFDWSLLANSDWKVPWLLAGGLNADNLAEAVRISGATTLDVSSGVEDAPGVKSPQKIRQFLELAQEV